MAAIPDKDLASKLATALGAPWVIGTTVFSGPERPAGNGIPTSAIFVTPYSGGRKTHMMGGPSTPNIRRPKVQVLVRGEVGDYDGARTLARLVYDAVDVLAMGSDYCGPALAIDAEPVWLNISDTEAPRWGINVEMVYAG